MWGIRSALLPVWRRQRLLPSPASGWLEAWNRVGIAGVALVWPDARSAHLCLASQLGVQPRGAALEVEPAAIATGVRVLVEARIASRRKRRVRRLRVRDSEV